MDDKDKQIEDLSNIVGEQNKIIEATDKAFDTMFEHLQKILKTITHVNDILGFTDRYNNIKMLIKKYGWKYVCQGFHPDNNPDDPGAFQMFELCKYIHEDMKRKGEV